MGSPVNLSNVSVDFETLLSELINELQSRDTWKDLLVSSTGTTLIEFMASIGVFNQYNIEMSFREAFLARAYRDSSIYGIARMLGISIPRKTPSIVKAEIENKSNSTIYITPKSRFIGNSIDLYNPSQINIAPGQVQTISLKEGLVKKVTFPATLEKYKEYIIGEPNFVIADADLRVIIRDDLSGSEELWERSDSSIWMHGEYDKVYFESTLENGDVSIFFGDGKYGAMPPVNTTIVIEYSVTVGSKLNSGLLTSKVIYSGNSSVEGKVTEYYASGDNEKPSKYYKLYAPHIYKSRNRAVSKTDYISIILGHRDVAGATVQAQRDLYPGDPMWMNTVRICVLSSGPSDTFGGVNPNPTSAKWTEFLNWFQPKCGAAMQIQKWNPTKLTVDVTVNLALKQIGDPETIENIVRENISKLFYKDMYSLGKAIYLSDIDSACKVENVDYVTISTPTDNIKPSDEYTFAALGNLTVNCFYSERTSLPTYRL